MRLLALALALLSFSSSAATRPKVAYLQRSRLLVNGHVVARHAGGGLRWSGDGKLLSVAGQVIGGPRLTDIFALTWAPTGETAAFTTPSGGAGIWTPSRGRRTVVPSGWGAQSLAWGPGGRLAIGRAVCKGRCGRPTHTEIWIWRRGRLRRLLGPLSGDTSPVPFAWSRGHVLWWRWPDSTSLAADGVSLYSGRTRLAGTLMYNDYVSVCGRHLAVAAGGDRYAMHGKRILFDGRDVSRDRSRSWVSPSCSPSGTLVAAASVNTTPRRLGSEHRAIWQLLPSRRQLTHPPAGLSDENPRLLPDGSIVFVRTTGVSKPFELYGTGTIELLRRGRLTPLGVTGKADNFYGHYDWPDVVAVYP